MTTTLELRHLQRFVTLTEELHFGRAAERLGIAQSALSTHIKDLERHLEVRLLHRNKRTAVSLTEAGLLFLREAKLTLQQAERAELVGRRAGQVGSISIGYVASAAFAGILPATVLEYRQTHPMVEVRLEQMATPRQLQGLTEGRVDVAFLRPRSRYPTGIAVVWLLREPIWIALRHDHPLILGENSTLTAASLAEEAFIVPGTEKGSGLHEQAAAVGQHGGFEPRIANFTLDFVAVITMVAAGFGIAVVPASVRSLLVPGVTYRALSDVAAYAGLAAAYRHNERSPIVRDLIKQVEKSAVASEPPPPHQRSDSGK